MVAAAVMAAPVPLMAARRVHPGGLVRRQWTTRPACDNVNPMKTPMANRGMSVVGVAAHRDQQRPGGDGEDQHAVAEHQPAVPHPEEVG